PASSKSDDSGGGMAGEDDDDRTRGGEESTSPGTVPGTSDEMSSSMRSHFGPLNVLKGYFGHKYYNGSFAGHSTIKTGL
ncbi:hypothetical protein TorRG33x02_127930, partial [Trema orientale]